MTAVSVWESGTDTSVILYSAYIAQAYAADLCLQRFLISLLLQHFSGYEYLSSPGTSHYSAREPIGSHGFSTIGS